MRAHLVWGHSAATHLSCLVWLTMERTFSSPSIFGLPNSSSFTCCRKQSRAQTHSQAWNDAFGKLKAACIAPPSPASGCQSSWERLHPQQGQGGCSKGSLGMNTGTGLQEIPGAPALAPQGKAQQSARLQSPPPPPISYFSEVSTIFEDFVSVK